MEINEKSFDTITGDKSIGALLVLTTQLLIDITAYLDSDADNPSGRRLLERCQEIITLLSHDLWLTMDDGK